MDAIEFALLWQKLCKRFGRSVDTDEGLDYLQYLNARLSVEQIRQGADVIWATREFFPRPIDFVIGAHAGALSQLRQAALKWRENERSDWLAAVGGVGSLAQRVIVELGGIHEVSALLDRGARSLREEFESRVHELLATDARALPAPLPRLDAVVYTRGLERVVVSADVPVLQLRGAIADIP